MLDVTTPYLYIICPCHGFFCLRCVSGAFLECWPLISSSTKQHEFNDGKFFQNIMHQGSQYFMLDFSLLGILVYIFVFSLHQT
jgi:hypothetical protein